MCKIFYQSDLVTLWHGDSSEILKNYESESFHLLLTDPPYGMNFQSNMRTEVLSKIVNDGKDEDSRNKVLSILLECVRLVRRDRHLYVFGDEILRKNDAKVSAPAELIWIKQEGPGMGDLSCPWGPQHEKLFFYTCKNAFSGQRGEEVKPVRLRKGNVLKFTKPVGLNVRHPTEKPVNLLKELIESSSKQSELILDPFAGIGSTGVAAVLLGRRVLLCEIEEKYCEIAMQRIKKSEEMIYNQKLI